MKILTKLNLDRISSRFIGLLVIAYCCISLPLIQFGQEANKPMGTETKRFGNVEAKEVSSSSGFYPAKQPEVYWHDDAWTIDLLPLTSLSDSYKLRVSSSDGKIKNIVQLPPNYALIRSIQRDSDDKAIVIADITGTTTIFCIINLNPGKVVDQIAMIGPSVSPDRRFILYVNGFPAHGLYGASDYRLYDTLKTPRENTCGFRDNDPNHKDLDESYRGFQVYPLLVKGSPCLAELPEGEDHQEMSGFVWSPDSGQVVFADALHGLMSLVIVQMPATTRDLPRTIVYPLSGAENVCGEECNPGDVRSLAWEDDGIRATLFSTPEIGPNIERVVTVPFSKFVAARNPTR